MTLLVVTYADGSTETVTADVLVTRIVRAEELHQRWLDAGRDAINWAYATMPADQFAELIRPFCERGLIDVQERG